MDTNPNLNNIKDEDLIEIIRSKFQFHLEEADSHTKQAEHHTKQATKFKSLLGAYEGILAEQPQPLEKPLSTLPVNGFRKRLAPKDPSEMTFEEFVLARCKSDQKPRLVSTITEEYNSIAGKDISSKDISSKLSTIRKKGKLKQMVLEDLPREFKYWWAPSVWFDGDKLKQEYIEKINSQIMEAQQQELVKEVFG